MVLEPSDLFANFQVDFGEEIGGRGIERTGEHEILPDQQAQLVAGGVETFRLVAPPAPDPDHVHMRIRRRLQERAGLLRRDPAGERVGHDPVGALHEHVAAVHPEGEAFARGVGVADELDGSEADPPCRHGIANCDGEEVEGLSPLPVRPPELGFVDLECNRETGPLDLARDLDAAQAHCHRRRVCIGDLGVHRHAHPAGCMLLMNRQNVDPRRPRGLQPYVAVDPERRQRDVPVPAEIGLDLPEHVAVRDLVVLRMRHREGLGRGPFRGFAHRGAEQDLDRVLALDGDLGEVDPGTAELVLGREHKRAVPADLGDAVEAGDHEVDAGVVEMDQPPRGPVALAHPAAGIFVAAPVRVGDQPGLLECRHAVAGDADVTGDLAGLVGQGPEPGKGLVRGRRHVVRASVRFRDRTARRGPAGSRSRPCRQRVPRPGRPCAHARSRRRAWCRSACRTPSVRPARPSPAW